MALSVSLVRHGLTLRRHRKLILAACFFPVFFTSLFFLAQFLGTRSYNIAAVLLFSVLFGAIPFLAAEAVMLLPVKFLKFKLETGPTETIEIGCMAETAVARVWRIFSERKISARYLKHFTGHEGLVLDVIGAGKKADGETIISFNPFFAVSIVQAGRGAPVARMYYEKDREGLTLAETLKAKLKIA